MSGETDEALVARAQAGERTAFSALVERHYDAIHRFAWRRCGDASEAEDIAQEALIRIGRGLSGFAGRSSFRTWAFGVTLNCARDLIRARTRQAETLRAAAIAAEPATQDDVFEEEPETALWGAVRELPEAQRDAVLLVHVEGLSHREAAAALDCAEATVSWRLFAARRRLKTVLSRSAA